MKQSHPHGIFPSYLNSSPEFAKKKNIFKMTRKEKLKEKKTFVESLENEFHDVDICNVVVCFKCLLLLYLPINVDEIIIIIMDAKLYCYMLWFCLSLFGIAPILGNSKTKSKQGVWLL